MKRTRRCEFDDNAQTGKESSPKRMETDVWLLVLPGVPALASECILGQAGLKSTIGVCTIWRRVMLSKLNFRLAQTLESWIRGTVDDELQWFSQTCALLHRLHSNGAISSTQIRERYPELVKKADHFANTVFCPKELRKPATEFCPWSFYVSEQDPVPSFGADGSLSRLRVALETGISPSVLHTVLRKLAQFPRGYSGDEEDPDVAIYRQNAAHLLGDLILHEYPVELLYEVFTRLGGLSLARCSPDSGYFHSSAVPSPAYVRAVSAAYLPALHEFLLEALECARRAGRWGQPHQDLLRADVISLQRDMYGHRTAKLAFKLLDFKDMLRHSWCSMQYFELYRLGLGRPRIRRDELMFINAKFDIAMSPHWFMLSMFSHCPDPVSAVKTVIGDDPTGFRARIVRRRAAEAWNDKPSELAWLDQVLEIAGYAKPVWQREIEDAKLELPAYYTELARKAGMSS